ncbi:phosphodiester glycosidase family protein [Domibacillus sp. 8LH]|uniref:phosphodiester glycosidase family protein n=1 Tax=Domibacillus sp. 8LH TaxID=3073900 RepID=UPI0031822658
MKRVRLGLLALMLLFPTWAQAAVTDEFDVSNGVTYTEIVEEGTVPQSVRVMEIDTTDPYTKVQAGVPDPLNKLVQTSKQALAASEEGHEVIGAINGSFFNREPMPLYFVAIDNYLVNGGMIETSKDEFVSEKIAFSINKEGKGQIDSYSTTFTYAHNGTTGTMAGHNGQRYPNTTMVYTPNFSSGVTTTNPYGYEVIVSGAGDPSLQFGGTLTGKVTGFRPYGQTAGAVIPKDGFVLSAHGTETEALRSMKIGDTVSVSVDVDEKWKGADFMIGSGPLLVKDGKVALTMNPNSPKARERAPRTAVAIDQTGEKVAFITVDGRQPGYSTGMSLSEFAAYIRSLGYDRALNMDGGGSTTMLAREPGDFTATIQNKPSDPWGERPVSTFLMAITTAPKGVPTTINASLSSDAPLAVGETVGVNIHSIMDEYGNPVKVENVTITSDLGTVSGTTFTAARSGSGFISVKKGNAEVKLPITVQAQPESRASVLDSFEGVSWSVPSVSTFYYDGSRSLKVDGTVRPVQPIALSSSPSFVSLRVYGQADGAEIIGTFLDAKGTAHQASFGSVTWNGWKNVRVPVQAGWTKLSALSSSKPGVYVDSLKAVYGTSYKEELFRDVPVDFRAERDIVSLVDRAVVSGFPNGTFGPQQTLTRVQAAIMLQRAMKLPTDGVKDPGFSDVPKTYAFYGSIAAVTQAGIMFGRTDGTFDAQAKLTRAEMAAVLARALKLPEANRNYFPDNNAGTFAYSSVNALAASGITQGFPDGTFRPGEPIKRADFSIFLNRGLEKTN